MKIYISVLLFLFTMSSYAQDNSTIYNVKAEISTLKNRTLSCKVRNHTVIVDQPQVFGADDLGPTPPEMLAIAYGSCVVSTMQLLALQRNLEMTDISVKVEGTIDFAKALGISDANRSGFSGLKLKIQFKSDMTKSQKGAFVNDVLKIGAAIDNVDNPTPVSYEVIE